ncbi:MAG TPA: beta-1,6-N-acetylglucosaminyltransferase [Polyangia bacterium]|nr:beta-1,6-N-acetylglucosaminyltransferase [Polyangia bacterium]
MAIAYLITAYDCPHHFARLIAALLDSKDAHVFVHIDAKTELAPFRQSTRSPRVHFSDNRVLVHWGQFSMVEAVLNLMTEALARTEAFDYLCMLSGTDYPLRGAGYIDWFFGEHAGTEFINLAEMPSEERGKPIDRLPDDHAQRLGGLRPFGGSPWWALTRGACNHVLRFAEERSDVIELFREVRLPEESFIHTIVGNSPYAARITRNLTYVDWTREPGSAHPAILDEKHLPLLTRVPLRAGGGEHELLFARKFPDDSESLVAQLAGQLAADAAYRR